MYIPKLFLISILLLAFTQAVGMKHPATINTNQKLIPLFSTIPDEILINIIVQCEAKDMLRQACKYFKRFATKKLNNKILIHPNLRLTQAALRLFFLEYGALGEVAVLRNLLHKGADPNTCDDKRMTVMHYAAECGDVDTANLLLGSSAFITTDIAKGEQSPFQLAVKNGHTGVIKSFVEKGAIEVNGLGDHLILAVGNKGSTINDRTHNLHSLSKNGCYYGVKILLQHDVNLNRKDSWDDSAPLHSASRYGYFHIVTLLLHNGANVNAKNSSGRTPLHEAIFWNHPQIVRILLHHGANVNAKDNDNRTPLHRACVGRRCDIVRILLYHGADVNECSRGVFYGYNTPLDEALSQEYIDTEVIQILKKHGAKKLYELDDCRVCVIQ